MRRSIALLTIAAAVLFVMFASSTPVAFAQPQPQSLLTRHVRDVTLNGQAPSGSCEEIGFCFVHVRGFRTVDGVGSGWRRCGGVWDDQCTRPSVVAHGGLVAAGTSG